MVASVLAGTADAVGRVLSRLTAGVAAWRSPEKPLHPDGLLFAGTLRRSGTPEACGVPWLDDAATDEVIVRVSRAVGLPSPLPDISGLALRLPGPADVLLASTGWDPVSRHLLLPALRAGQPLTTLLPYRTACGPVVLGARPVAERRFALFWARVGHGWRPLGSLTLDEPLPDDSRVSFDPVLNRPPGLEQYPWVVRIRERAYATARASRDEPADGT
jgi:hypothetical protein